MVEHIEPRHVPDAVAGLWDLESYRLLQLLASAAVQKGFSRGPDLGASWSQKVYQCITGVSKVLDNFKT